MADPDPGSAPAPLPSARRNLAWLLSGRVFQVVLGFVVAVAMARYLGPDLLGDLGVAVAFAGLFLPFGLIGAQFVVRDLSVEPDKHHAILGSAAAIGALSGLLSFVLAVATAAIFLHDQRNAVALVAIVSTPLLVTPFKAVEYWFESGLRSKYLVIGRTVALGGSSVLRIAAIALGADLVTFAVLVAAEQITATLIIVWFFVREPDRPSRWAHDARRTKDLALRSIPLVVAGLAIGVYMRIDQVMLGFLSTSEQTGIYAAAVKLSESANFIPVAVAATFAPGLARLKDGDPTAYDAQSERMFTVLTSLALAIAIPAALLAPLAVPLLLGSAYAGTGVVLSVHVLSNVFVFLGVGESIWTTNAGLQRLVMWRAIAGAVVNVMLNVVLIPAFGALGAAVATLIAYAVATMVGNAVNRSTRHLLAIELRSFRPRTIVEHWRFEYRQIREGRGRSDRSPGSIGGS